MEAPAGPVRMCRVCRQRAAKGNLARWVIEGGRLVADAAKNRPGRGYYTDSDACAARLPKVLKLNGA